MKRLILLVSLGVTAGFLVPVASASAARVGSCELAGTAKFAKPITAVPTEDGYEFNGSAHCREGLNTPSGTVAASGVGILSCEAGGSIGYAPAAVGPGKASITIEEETTEYALSFAAAVGVVPFVATPPLEVPPKVVLAVGAVQFLTNTKSTEECVKKLEASELKFTGDAVGVI